MASERRTQSEVLSAPQLYVPGDIDLRHGICSASAKSHLQEQSVGAPACAQTSADFSGNGQSARIVSLPGIDEVADVRRLDQNLDGR